MRSIIDILNELQDREAARYFAREAAREAKKDPELRNVQVTYFGVFDWDPILYKPVKITQLNIILPLRGARRLPGFDESLTLANCERPSSSMEHRVKREGCLEDGSKIFILECGNDKFEEMIRNLDSWSAYDIKDAKNGVWTVRAYTSTEVLKEHVFMRLKREPRR